MIEPSMNASSRRSKIVMGVDDAPESLALLNAVVTGAGYSFIGVNSGAECIRLIARSQPRLLLLDIEMPEMDGIELCRRIRALRDYVKIPIAFLTAKKTGEAVRAGIGAGGNDFIVKPFDVIKLLERVNHWVTRPAPQADPFSKPLVLG